MGVGTRLLRRRLRCGDLDDNAGQELSSSGAPVSSSCYRDGSVEGTRRSTSRGNAEGSAGW